jgi:hypothetical protein
VLSYPRLLLRSMLSPTPPHLPLFPLRSSSSPPLCCGRAGRCRWPVSRAGAGQRGGGLLELRRAWERVGPAICGSPGAAASSQWPDLPARPSSRRGQRAVGRRFKRAPQARQSPPSLLFQARARSGWGQWRREARWVWRSDTLLLAEALGVRVVDAMADV